MPTGGGQVPVFSIASIAEVNSGGVTADMRMSSGRCKLTKLGQHFNSSLNWDKVRSRESAILNGKVKLYCRSRTFAQ